MEVEPHTRRLYSERCSLLAGERCPRFSIACRLCDPPYCNRWRVTTSISRKTHRSSKDGALFSPFIEVNRLVELVLLASGYGQIERRFSSSNLNEITPLSWSDGQHQSLGKLQGETLGSSLPMTSGLPGHRRWTRNLLHIMRAYNSSTFVLCEVSLRLTPQWSG